MAAVQEMYDFVGRYDEAANEFKTDRTLFHNQRERLGFSQGGERQYFNVHCPMATCLIQRPTGDQYIEGCGLMSPENIYKPLSHATGKAEAPRAQDVDQVRFGFPNKRPSP